MKVTYNREMDTLIIIFTEVPVAESDEDKPGIILDYDYFLDLKTGEVEMTTSASWIGLNRRELN